VKRHVSDKFCLENGLEVGSRTRRFL
jgi:hypothetical protein